MPLLIISFVAGVLTILAPCILPLLPVIVGRSISDPTLSRRRMIIVVASLGVSIVLFTLLLKATSLLVNIPEDFWKYISGGIIFIFGLVTLFPGLWERISFVNALNRKSNETLAQGYQKNSFWGDVIVGASLGPIFSACSPTYFVILATVLPAKPVVGMIYLFTYCIGLSLALFAVALLGQKILTKLNFATDSRGWFKRTLGVIFIIVALGILTGYDKKLQISLLDAGFFDVTKIEQGLLDEDTSANDKEDSKDFLSASEKAKKFISAPDLSSIDGYINTDGKPITIGEFKGKKVVLLDIWTYSCINCQRTLPYLNDWYKKYEDEGLVIIGLHTPEFAFEHIQENVEDAVEEFGVKYPVVLDNDFSTWRAYRNQYWPRKYLIDIDGYIVYDHAGEGEYDVTEREIKRALLERKERLGLDIPLDDQASDPPEKIIVDPRGVQSPEIYFGSARNERLANGRQKITGTQTFVVPDSIEKNELYLGGEWFFNFEYAKNKGVAEVVFKYEAKNVYMVADSEEGADVEVYVDGKLVNTLRITEEKLYDVVRGIDYAPHTLILKIKTGSIEADTFTFG